jgi:hypothetical protein
MSYRKRDLILNVMLDGAWHGGEEFLDGRHGFFCSSYSQRIGDLMDAGCTFEREQHGIGDARLGYYRLVSVPGTRAEGDGQVALV